MAAAAERIDGRLLPRMQTLTLYTHSTHTSLENTHNTLEFIWEVYIMH